MFLRAVRPRIPAASFSVGLACWWYHTVTSVRPLPLIRGSMPDLSQMTDRYSVPSALLSDINLNLVREHIDTAIKRRGYDGPTEPEEYLIEHGCLLRDDDGALTPTLA